MDWLMTVPLWLVVFASCVLAAGYTVLGATGFGAGVVSIPFLAYVLPLSFIVPFMCLVDIVATGFFSLRRRNQVNKAEILGLLPGMLVGMALGVWLLTAAPPRWLLGALGLFIFCYGAYNLALRQPTWRWPAATRLPFGMAGGFFSAVFGSGGPLYAIFFAGRISDKDSLRATIATTITVAVSLRFAGFVGTGLILQPHLLGLALLCLPAVALGFWLGNRVHHRLPREGILKLMSWVLVANGVVLMVRAWDLTKVSGS
jgi:uncharacterized protein